MSALSQIQVPDGTTYEFKDSGALRAAAAAPEFSASTAYAVGDAVTKDGLVYRCTAAHSGAWNAAHFTVVDQLISAGGKVNASLLPAATTSALGAVKPDGTTITILNGVITAVGGGGGGGTGDMHYAIVTPTVTTSTTDASNDTISATLQDCAINIVTAGSGVAYVNLAFPSAVSGKSRDLMVRLTVTGTTAPQVAFTGAGTTFDADDDEWANVEQGVNLIMFTETNVPS